MAALRVKNSDLKHDGILLNGIQSGPIVGGNASRPLPLTTVRKDHILAGVPSGSNAQSTVLDREVLLYLLAAFFLHAAIEPSFCSLGIGKCKTLYCE